MTVLKAVMAPRDGELVDGFREVDVYDLPGALSDEIGGVYLTGDVDQEFLAEHRDAPAAYPQLHHLTAPLRKAAVAAGDPQVAHLWAGTGHALARPGPAAEITRSLTP